MQSRPACGAGPNGRVSPVAAGGFPVAKFRPLEASPGNVMTEVLVVYYSRSGSTAELARQVCRGIESVPSVSAKLRTVPAVSADNEGTTKLVPDRGPPYATHDDCRGADGLVLGSP